MKIYYEIDKDSILYDHNKGRVEAFKIWFDFDDKAYPCEGWYDNGLVLLSWWVTSWESMTNGLTNQGLAFMEGPYKLNMEQNGTDLLLIDPANDIKITCNLLELGKELKHAVNGVLRHFKNIGIDSHNIHNLMKCLTILEKNLHKIKE
ncbi:MAG: hypothetical protein OXT67_00685 [Zetaproteobacteria bacterium]|nr:hypothetical protein [Zetaproteobacteria bacterium]